MKLENAGELVSIGAKIVQLGTELDGARIELNEAQANVNRIEAELRPLLARHAELIQSAVGAGSISLSPLPAAPAPLSGPEGVKPTALNELSLAGAGTPASLPASAQLKARVKDFLKTRVKDDTISASEVADALHIDALIVREAMLELRHGR